MEKETTLQREDMTGSSVDHRIEEKVFWFKFAGIVTLILGVVNALFGLLAFLIGAIPGVIIAYQGVKLINAGNTLKEAKDRVDLATYKKATDELLTFSKIEAILLSLAIVVFLLGFLFVGISFFQMLTYM